MDSIDIRALIMSGGRGKRFWPLSQVNLPKQFIQLYGEGTLFQQTFRRLRLFLEPERIYTVTRGEYSGEILAEVPEFIPENIIVEPSARNTAPCIGLGTILAAGDDRTILINLPADHYISDEQLFADTLQRAASAALRHDAVVTLGVPPTFPHDGYAYIHAKEPVPDGEGLLIADRFHEKPQVPVAQSYLEQGHHYWNSGIFVWRRGVILKLFQQYLPRHYQALAAIRRDRDKRIAGTLHRHFQTMPEISIDYGIMEQLSQDKEQLFSIHLLPVEFAWSDLGSWSAIERQYRGTSPAADNVLVRGTFSGLTSGEIPCQGNLVLRGEVHALNTRNCTFRTEMKVAVLGAEDLLVIQDEDRLLICRKSDEGHLGAVVDSIEQ